MGAPGRGGGLLQSCFKRKGHKNLRGMKIFPFVKMDEILGGGGGIILSQENHV